jgi:hypothetical protein
MKIKNSYSFKEVSKMSDDEVMNLNQHGADIYDSSLDVSKETYVKGRYVDPDKRDYSGINKLFAKYRSK